MPGVAPGPEPIGTIWHIALPGAPPPVEPALPAAFERLGVEAAPELARAMGLADARQVQQRFDGGRRCYAARAQGRLAAYGWVSFGGESVGSLALQLRLLPGEAYIWDCATLPAFQRQGLYAALLGHIIAALAAERLRGVWIGADFHNQPSHAGINRAGFTALADLVAAPAAPSQRRRRGWLQARPGITPAQQAEAERVYLGGCKEVWLFDEGE